MPIALSSATPAAEDLPLPIGVPTGRTELNGGMSEPVDRFCSPFDKGSTIGAGACHR